MTTRRVVTAVAILALGGFAFLTVSAMIESGVSFLSVVSLAVLVLLGVGILGALAQQPPEE